MTAPTGEAINYRTTVAELDAMDRQLGQMLDFIQAGVAATRQAADHLDAVESQRRPLAAAAISAKEHLEGMSLDPTTMAGVDSACESLTPNAVGAILEMLESAEKHLLQVLAAIEAAKGGVSASKQNVIGTYGSAADVVEQTGVNAQFLNSDGSPGRPGNGHNQAGGAAQPQPTSDGASSRDNGEARGGQGGNVGASAGRGETVNVDGDAVGSRRTGAGSPWTATPAAPTHSVGAVVAPGGVVNAGGDITGTKNGS